MERPYIIVNLAMSADGKISTRERRQVRISGPSDFARVDRLKAGCDGIMVGIGTVLADDPSLTVKSPHLVEERVRRGHPEHPARIVVDSRARIPLTAAVLHRGSGRRIVACSAAAEEERVTALRKYAEVVVAGESEVDLPTLMRALHDMGISRLMVEGGGTLIWALFAAGLVDELITFVGNMVIGGKDAPTPADGIGFTREDEFPNLSLYALERMDQGALLHWIMER